MSNGGNGNCSHAPARSGWMSDEEWLAARQKLVTATDTPAILGLDPERSALRVYTDKLGLTGPDAANERMKWGLRLQDDIAEAYAEATGRSVRPPEDRLSIHPRIPWMGASLDFVVEDEELGVGVLETKATEKNVHEGQMPERWLVQLAHQMEVLQASWGSLAVLVRGNHLVWQDVPANDRLAAGIIERLEAFWRCLLVQTPPPPDDSESSSRALKALYSAADGSTVTLPPESGEWARAYAQASEELRRWGSVKTAAQNQLMAAIGNATYAVAGDGSRWSFKSQPRAGYTVQPSEVRILRAQAHR